MVEWWPQYRCPKCDYTTTVTNVCRSCGVWMCATGTEHRFIKGEDGRILENEDGTFKEEWRPITKESELYRQAMSASWSFKNGIEVGDWEGPIPDWVWFGDRKI